LPGERIPHVKGGEAQNPVAIFSSLLYSGEEVLKRRYFRGWNIKKRRLG
jgi:hypothetical protein